MKKVMGILLASTLILGACGHHQDSAKKESASHKKKEKEFEEEYKKEQEREKEKEKQKDDDHSSLDEV